MEAIIQSSTSPTWPFMFNYIILTGIILRINKFIGLKTTTRNAIIVIYLVSNGRYNRITHFSLFICFYIFQAFVKSFQWNLRCWMDGRNDKARVTIQWNSEGGLGLAGSNNTDWLRIKNFIFNKKKIIGNKCSSTAILCQV